MNLQFGREICGNIYSATAKEWLVTNGLGGYASGTISGILTRRYHALLIAALNPPVQRTLLLTKLEETVNYLGQSYQLFTNCWQDDVIKNQGYLYLESFRLENQIPIWTYAIADSLIEKRIWMEQGQNTTYIQYTVKRATDSLNLSLKALVNYRDHHHEMQDTDRKMNAIRVNQGIKIIPSASAIPFYLMSDVQDLDIQLDHNWHLGFNLEVEKYRGLNYLDNHLDIATFSYSLGVNQSLTIIATTESDPNLKVNEALSHYHQSQEFLLSCWQQSRGFKSSPQWINQLVLAANQFIVNRSFANQPNGKTIIAGYPWFSDWGRDTAISLTGLTLVTGRFKIARQILLTFSNYLSQGMLPNCFPDGGESPIYNTVDAVFWYFESVNQYYQFTHDLALIEQLFPLLDEVIDWHCQGTRYQIHLDKDGLIYAGEKYVQLTWMDAKVDDWVVTPRHGKPIEINALWYNALQIMIKLGHLLGQSTEKYETLAQQTKRGFQAFWNESLGYCYDVIDSPNGNDTALRPNQIFAVSFNQLLSPYQEKSIVDTVSQHLLTPYGLRSLSPNNNNYQGQYGGDRYQRDGQYHQGTTWGWLISHFVQAHLKVYQNPQEALSFLALIENHLTQIGMGSMSEIFDGDPPFTPRGCFAQAWSVAEVLRAFYLCQTDD